MLEAHAATTGGLFSVHEVISLDIKKKKMVKQASVQLWLLDQKKLREEQAVREAEAHKEARFSRVYYHIRQSLTNEPSILLPVIGGLPRYGTRNSGSFG